MNHFRSLLLPVLLLLMITAVVHGQDNPGPQPQQWNRGLTRLNWAEVPISLQVPGDTLRHGVDSARRVSIIGSVLYVSVKDPTGSGIHWVPISGSGGGGKDTVIFQGGDTTVQNIINQYFGDTIINYLYTTYKDSITNFLITNQYFMDTVVQAIITNQYFQDTVVQQVFNTTYFQDTVIQQIFNNSYFKDTVVQSIFNNTYFQDTVVQSIFNNQYFFDTAIYNSLLNTYVTNVVTNYIDSSLSVFNPLQTHQQTLITGSRMTQNNAIILDNTRYAWTFRDSTVTSDTSGSSAIVIHSADVGVLIAPKSSWASVAPLLKTKTLRDGVSFNSTSGGGGVYKSMANAGYKIALTVNAYPIDSTHGFPATADERDLWSCNMDSLMLSIDSSGAIVPWIHIENEPTTLKYRIDPLHHLADYIQELSIAVPIVHAHGRKISDGGPASVNLKWVIWDWLRKQSGRSMDADEFKQFEFTSSQQATIDGWETDPNHADAIAFIKGLYAAEDTMAVDAANFHWYIQDWQSSVHANSLIWAVEAIHALSGKKVTTNELGQQNELSNIPPQALAALDSRVEQIIWFDGDGTAARALHNPDNTLRTNGIAFVNYEQGLLNPPVVDTTGGSAAVVSYQEKQFFSLENGSIYQRNKKKNYTQLALMDTSGRVNWVDTAGLFHGGTGGTAGVTSFNSRTGVVTLTSSDVTTALGYTPYNVTNPAGYISGNQSITFTGSGDVSGSATGTTALSPTLTLATVNPNVGTFGSISQIPVITTDGKGRITAVSTASLSGAFVLNQTGLQTPGNFNIAGTGKLANLVFNTLPGIGTSNDSLLTINVATGTVTMRYGNYIKNQGAQLNGTNGMALPATNTVAASLNKLKADTAYFNYINTVNENVNNSITVGNVTTTKYLTAGGIFETTATTGIANVKGYLWSNPNAGLISPIFKSEAILGVSGAQTNLTGSRLAAIWGATHTYDNGLDSGGIMIGVRADANFHGYKVDTIFAFEGKIGVGYNSGFGAGLHPSNNVPFGATFHAIAPTTNNAFPHTLDGYATILLDDLSGSSITAGSVPYQIWSRGTTGISRIEQIRIAFPNLPVFTSNAAAITGGVAVGELYRNGDFIGIVH